MFKVGDKVRCVDATKTERREGVPDGSLHEGAEYTVSSIACSGWICLGGFYAFRPERFVLKEDKEPQPDVEACIRLPREERPWLEKSRVEVRITPPDRDICATKIMLVGPSRCGKDEAGQFLESITGLRFAGTTSKYLSPYVSRCLGMNEEDCYAKRHDMREAWYHVGRAVRSGDPGILVRESLQHGEIIGGVRDKEEVIAARELVNLIVWIENERCQKDPTLMFGPECCDIIIPNNGTLEEYHERLTRFANALDISAGLKIKT